MHKLSIVAALVLLSACGEAPISQPTGDGLPQISDIPASAKTTEKPIALGETGKGKGVDFTITKVTTTSQIGPAGSGPKAEPTETFVVVHYTIKNTSGAALSAMDRPAISLVDAKGQRYVTDDMAGIMVGVLMDDASGMSADLNPGVSAKTGTAWKVAKDGFDKATWRIVVETDPALTFALDAGDANGKAN